MGRILLTLLAGQELLLERLRQQRWCVSCQPAPRGSLGPYSMLCGAAWSRRRLLVSHQRRRPRREARRLQPLGFRLATAQTSHERYTSLPSPSTKNAALTKAAGPWKIAKNAACGKKVNINSSVYTSKLTNSSGRSLVLKRLQNGGCMMKNHIPRMG